MKTGALVLAAALASALSGCAVAAVGRPIPPEQVRTIERNVTTLEQARERFGEPWRRTPGASDHLGPLPGYPDPGLETWRYRYVASHPRRRALEFCDSFDLGTLTGLFISCSRTRLEQELSLVVDQRVVTSYTYESREVLHEVYEPRIVLTPPHDPGGLR